MCLIIPVCWMGWFRAGGCSGHHCSKLLQILVWISQIVGELRRLHYFRKEEERKQEQLGTRQTADAAILGNCSFCIHSKFPPCLRSQGLEFFCPVSHVVKGHTEWSPSRLHQLHLIDTPGHPQKNFNQINQTRSPLNKCRLIPSSWIFSIMFPSLDEESQARGQSLRIRVSDI